jgi:putative alpha-1,2-mannosidase
MLRFAEKQESVVTRIATSFISFEQAALNLANEIGRKPLEAVRAGAAQQWKTYADRIQIQDGSERQREVFYSCLYRALLFPHTWHELDTDGKPHHFGAFDGKVHPGVMYADHGYWDVYRAWYPLMSIVYPENSRRFCRHGSTRTKKADGCRNFLAQGIAHA